HGGSPDVFRPLPPRAGLGRPPGAPGRLRPHLGPAAPCRPRISRSFGRRPGRRLDRRTEAPRRPRLFPLGWRCTAPGCTSRKNLDDHHVVYRSRRGGNALDNRTCLCRFHHKRGEHGELASCRGKAPLGILWRLGKKDLGVWYRNERRVGPPAPGTTAGSHSNHVGSK
ncbi:MAG TPA: HNH endonuclease signature motif containing protein, partial [Candidatus Polarisedimenticolia bacterium]|nr:HNH endonuclease signature motif containing protein [Candidatus Polarisedimenticolia bacterium]